MAAFLRTIVIVGGGFSGTAVAINLLRNPPRRPTRVVLIDRDGAFGRGLAYAQRDFPYLLNVPAGRMSARAEAPLEFLQFAQRRYAQAGAHDFLPRAVFGDYLNELLITAQLQSPRHVLLERLQATVVAVQRTERHLQLRVALASGQELYADDVVLALGNPPQTELAPCAAIRTSAAYFPEPWSRNWDLHAQRSALIIGTGLTMADVVFRSTAVPELTPRMHALSRHGLIAPEQTQFRPDAFKGNGEALLLAASSSLRRVVDVTRILANEAQSLGGDWREAVNFVRHMAPTLWQRMPAPDRQRFLRHLRSYWDIHRHRPAPQVLRRIRAAQSTQRLQVHAGRIQEMAPAATGIRVRWTPRGRSETRELHVDQVINCTGPDYNPIAARDPLIRQLLNAGLITCDAHRLGIRTGAHCAVVDRDGWPGPHLFYIGPMLRADHWEATAVAELRVHAARLASHLATTGESNNGSVTALERAS